MARPATALLLALLVALPATSGCLDFLFPPPRPPAPPADVRLGDPFLARDVHFSFGSTFANFEVTGSPVAFGVLLNGTEVGALFLDANASYRADAVLRVFFRSLRTSFFVEGPAGQWEPVAQRGWQPIDNATAQALGHANTSALSEAARPDLPANLSDPKPGTWVFNGTFGGVVTPEELVLIDGTFFFKRNSTSSLFLQNRTLVQWDAVNRTLDATVDAVFHLAGPDIVLRDVAEGRFDAEIITPPFRRADVKANNLSGVLNIDTGHANVTVLAASGQAPANYTIQDNRVTIWTPKMVARILGQR